MSDDFSIELISGVTVIKLNMMRATVKEAQEFKKIIQSVMQNGNNKIIIDFAQCSFVDSSIIGVIVTLSKDFRNKGGEIKGVMNEESLLSLFEQTGLEKIIRHYPNLELSLSSFND